MSGKPRKAQFYVWYLGWKECHGLAGRDFTEPIVRELVKRRRNEVLPKLTIEVGRKELKVVQLVEKKKGKVEKVKYPAIPNRDVTYAVQAMPPDDDVVACIYLGYNASTNSAVHVHVYRCDSPDTAAIFVNNLEMFFQNPEHQERIRNIEAELVRKGQIVMRPVMMRQHDHFPQKDFPYGAPNGHSTHRSNTSDDGIHFKAGSGSYSSGSGPHSPRSPLEEHVPVFGNRNSLNSSHGDRSLARQSSRNSSQNEDNVASPSPRSSNYGSVPPRHENGQNNAQAYHKESPPMKNEHNEEESKAFSSLADELKAKLASNQEAPILLPPKDYDTISRGRGNAFDLENRKCMNKDIVGNSFGLYNSNNIEATKGQKHFRNSSDAIEQELLSMSPTEEYPNSPFIPPTRPFSPGPLTKDLAKNSYFPNGSSEQLPNYLQRRASAQNQGNHSRQSSNDQSSLDNSMDKRQFSSSDGAAGIGSSSGKYSAAKLGLSQKRPLQKQASSPEFKPPPQNRGGLPRRPSHDEGYTSMDRPDFSSPDGDHFSPSPPRSGRSSGSNTMRSDAAIDLAASLPAMKLRDHQRAQGTPVYIDEDDPGAFVPIDYTIAVRGGKDRKPLPN